jgi:penicillin-binding protein 2
MIQIAMLEVTTHKKGTATKYIKSKHKIKIAAKTGTAQVSNIDQNEKRRMHEDELAYFKRSHAWLTTYAPYNNPQYVVTVLVEHGGHGGSAAGGYVSKIYDKLIDLGYIKLP